MFVDENVFDQNVFGSAKRPGTVSEVGRFEKKSLPSNASISFWLTLGKSLSYIFFKFMK
jgi:hypothetical protein